jgi:hypothetical protein
MSENPGWLLWLVVIFGFTFEEVHENISFRLCQELLDVAETVKKDAKSSVKQDIQHLCQQTAGPGIDIRVRRARHKKPRKDEKY